MIPSNIEREHIIKAIREIDSNGILPGRESRSFLLIFEGKRYPPKYVLSLANKFANGEELDPSRFSGGQETNNFLKRLRFDIVEISLSGTICKSISSPKRTFERTQKGHDERCPECKKTIEGMLKEIYGNVESNYKFEVSINPEDYKDFLFYQKLKEILLELQKYRGYKDFVGTLTLPRCDFFVPNPRFILEFDEAQHFTLPRKISLQNYPQRLKLGFPQMKWISLCEKINAKDNDPPFRDEQRAWYDTIRDFLPEIKGLNPTVRLYSKDLHWCRLNPKDQNDVARFKSVVEKGNVKLGSWVATVVLQSDGKYSKSDRLDVLSKVIDLVEEKTTERDGVILFPGGWFNAGNQKATTLYKWVEEQVGCILSKKDRNLIACLGIDGRETNEWAKDQIGAAISKKGIIALGRKFHPAPKEKGYVDLANDHEEKEEDKSRDFGLGGRKYFICACYDSFGIKKKGIPNFGIDVILDLVHGFYPRGEDGSGDVYFAKHGFAGASKEWDCLVFGAAVFFNRKIPERWPSGVYWNQGGESTQKWRYEDNPIKPKIEFEVSIKEGIALVRIYNIELK
jgi:hypothetical protein